MATATATLLTNRRRDRASTIAELTEELTRKYAAAGGRLEFFRPAAAPGKFVALLVVLPPSLPSPLVAHELTGRPAELVWWQQDCRLLGFGFATSMAAAGEQALAAGDRGELARRDVTVWFDRGSRTFRFFRRDGGQRSEINHRPLGREIRAGDAGALLA